jgi:hypothetical protein
VASELKPTVDFDASFGLLDIRVGRVVSAEPCAATPKPTYRMVIDFGKYGQRESYGRFTAHPMEEVIGRLVLAVLNFPPRPMGRSSRKCWSLACSIPAGTAAKRPLSPRRSMRKSAASFSSHH